MRAGHVQVRGAANVQVVWARLDQVRGAGPVQVRGTANVQVVRAGPDQVSGAGHVQVRGTANVQVHGAGSVQVCWIGPLEEAREGPLKLAGAQLGMSTVQAGRSKRNWFAIL